MPKKIALVLSGCGFLDGGEIHETVLTMLHVVESGAELKCFAPNIYQKRVMNHLKKEEVKETRNVLVEAARIARSEIQILDELKAAAFDAVIFPGGFGAANNLCDFASKGAECSVDPQVERVLKEFYAAKKPIGAICIAPALVARVLGENSIQVTIGTDVPTAEQIKKTGAHPVNKNLDEIHVDKAHRIVSTPAYMLGKNIAQIDQGIKKLVNQILEMCQWQ